jgi:hypothetical protein
LGEATTRTRLKLPLNAFEHDFLAFVKLNFSSLEQANCMIFSIMVPMQLTESKFDDHKCQNKCPGFLSQIDLIDHGTNKMFEWHNELARQKHLFALFMMQEMTLESNVM